jgi:hypothetical protein
MIAEWRRGCSCGPKEAPEQCEECTRSLVDALERKLRADAGVQSKVPDGRGGMVDAPAPGPKRVAVVGDVDWSSGQTAGEARFKSLNSSPRAPVNWSDGEGQCGGAGGIGAR